MSNDARPVLSNDALSGFLGHVVTTITPHSEADPVGILGTLLSAFSAAVGSTPRVRVGYMSQPLSTWSVLIGATGHGRKGTATGNTMGLMRAGLPDWTEHAVLEGVPQSGPALISTLYDMNGTALMIEEEFADLLKVSARYKSFGKAIRRMWEGSSVANVTKSEAVQVQSPHVAIIGNVTPTEFLASIGKNDRAGGTLNRFLPLYVERSKVIPLAAQTSPQDWQALIKPLAQRMRSAVAYARDVEDVTPTREAVSLWDGGLRDTVERLSTGSEAMEQFAARAADYTWRISALYALADKREEITATDLRAGIAVVLYMAATVAYLCPDAGNGASMAAQVESFIRQAGPEGVNATLIYRRFSLKRTELETIVAGLDTIEISTGKSNGGRPPVIYRHVPKSVETDGTDSVPEDTILTGKVTNGAMPVRETGDVPGTRPVSLTDLEAVMYGPKRADPKTPSYVRELAALLDRAPEPADEVTGSEASVTSPEEEDEDLSDLDLSDLLGACTFARVA